MSSEGFSVTCEICDNKQTLKEMFVWDWKCDNCGQEYVFDEGTIIKLTDEQRQVLRDHWANKKGES